MDDDRDVHLRAIDELLREAREEGDVERREALDRLLSRLRETGPRAGEDERLAD